MIDTRSALLVAALLTNHFIGDFVLQFQWMALNKSQRWDALFAHTSVYSLTFLFWGWKFVLITFVTHTCVDFVTSMINAKLWQEKRMRGFFLVLGADQLIHFLTLILTLLYVSGELN